MNINDIQKIEEWALSNIENKKGSNEALEWCKEQYRKLGKKSWVMHLLKFAFEISYPASGSQYVENVITKEKDYMNLDEFISFFSSNLYIRKKGNKYQLVDSYHEGYEKYNYGAYYEFTDIEKLDIKYVIPDIYFDGLIDFYINDEFPNHYQMTKETINKIDEKLNKRGFENLDLICEEFKEYAAYNDLKDVCEVLRNEMKLKINEEKVYL